MPLYRAIPAAGSQPWGGDPVTSCPVAEAREWWVAEALEIHGALQVGGLTLRDLVATPSAQCVEALRLIECERSAIKAQISAPPEDS